jgi:ribosomal protein L37AE/L43A
MQQDPMEEWRRLTSLYSEMGDIEIRDLVGQINDLTPTAQQVLRDELKKRNLDQSRRTESSAREERESGEDPSIHAPDGDGPIDYSWKTPLCACASYVAARQLGEMLRRAKIDAWIDRSGSNPAIPWNDLGAGEVQVLVAADQLERAKVIASQPVPRDIIAEIEESDAAPAYEIPHCPRCKAEDPTLESVEPSNNWLCESCGYTWSDPIPDPTAPQATT